MNCKNCLEKQCSNKEKGFNATYPPQNAKPEDLPKITSIFLILTRDCNLKCKYCFVDKEHDNITYETAIDTVEFIAKNSLEYKDIPSLNFFGGEPTLRWNDIIVPLTRYVRSKYGKNFTLSMTSNGILFDDEKLRFMKENDIGLLFSIDGDKKTQDLNRPTRDGHSSFDILKDKIPLILKYFPNVTFRSTTDHDNVSEFFNNHKFAVENGFKSVFNIVNVFTNWSKDEKSELKRQIDMLGEYYARIKLEKRNICFSPFDEMFSKLKRIKEANCSNSYRKIGEGFLGFGRCGIGASRFASVGTDGKLYSCQEMVGNRESGHVFVIGDIYNGEDNKARLEIIKKYDPKKVVCSTGVNTCKSCKMNNICDGSCLINNYFTSGDFNIMPSILCFYYQQLLDKAEAIQNKYNIC